MISKLIKNYKLLMIFGLSFWIFYSSLFTFFTNDDFFFLKISKISNLSQFVNFFSLLKGPEGFGMYRPLSTQAFYFLADFIFGMNPFGLHVISFLVFFFVVYLVYRFVKIIITDLQPIKNAGTVALFSSLLYATSATHFAHLCYLATFQELLMTCFVLLSLLSFLAKKKLLTFAFFIFALLSKETAVVTPILLALEYWFINKKVDKLSIKKFLLFTVPFLITLLAYFYLRFVSYGFASGDTYVWDVSIRKFANTLVWYVLWSFNLPESLLDYVGPGLTVNPNLFIYWIRDFMPIFVLFIIEFLVIALGLLNSLKSKSINTSVFSAIWFIVTLLPVAFLPSHKFTFFLTLPLVGVVLRLSVLFSEKENIRLGTFFAVIWVLTSILTVKYSVRTSWITQGSEVAKRVFNYFEENNEVLTGKEIVFADTVKDIALPYSPTLIVKTALSNQNFFAVYYPDLEGHIHYGYTGKLDKAKEQIITSRTFLGY